MGEFTGITGAFSHTLPGQRNAWLEPAKPPRQTEYRICNCIGPQNGDPVCPCAMPAHRQHEAERAAWLREQLRLAEQMRPVKPRVRVKAKSRPATPTQGAAE